MLAELLVDGIHGLGHGGPFVLFRVLKERHLVSVFPRGRKGDAEEPHAFAQVYPVEDSDCGAVDFAGVVCRGG